ncbi:MAG: response regulator [Candidatus Staskawiczbacteria bacterium]|nr:response regulator [Candidatus Staskawiczbacteria bacterium]
MELNKKIIFLIEDDVAIIDVYKTVFKVSGIDFEVISWGKQAIDRIKEVQCGIIEKPKLVLLDLILPDMNGVEILREIRGNEKTKDIAVFVLSNYTSEEFSKVDGVKPDKFILKTSITPTKLVKLIKIQFKKD